MLNDELKTGERVCLDSSSIPANSSISIHPSSFPRSHRLSGKLLFSAVYDAKIKSTRGPLVMYSLANQLKHHRLGLSVSRKVGSAPQRNRIKRLIRESFRLSDSPIVHPVDVIVVVRPHAALPLAEYQTLLRGLLEKSQAAWQKISQSR